VPGSLEGIGVLRLRRLHRFAKRSAALRMTHGKKSEESGNNNSIEEKT